MHPTLIVTPVESPLGRILAFACPSCGRHHATIKQGEYPCQCGARWDITSSDDSFPDNGLLTHVTQPQVETATADSAPE